MALAPTNTRVKIRFTPSLQPVPYDYMHKLCGLVHKWLGTNELHDKVSLYSFSKIMGEYIQAQDGLIFIEPHMFLSTHDPVLTAAFKAKIESSRLGNWGMKVESVVPVAMPEFTERHFFRVGSGILLRGEKMDMTESKGHYFRPYYLADDSQEITTELLTKNLRHRMASVGLTTKASVYFAPGVSRWSQKSHKIGEIHNKVSIHPIVVDGDAEAAKFIWNVGAGQSTGTGFGFIL